MMKSLFQILEAISNQTLYFRTGVLRLAQGAPDVVQNMKKKYNIPEPTSSRFRSAVIKAGRDMNPTIVNPDAEPINRDDWDLTGLTGACERQLMHPHYWSMMDCMCDNLKRKRDILTILECSITKPYYNNSIISYYWRRYRAFSDFGAQVSCGIAPYSMSKYYPFRWNEWNHADETEDLAYKYALVSAKRFLKYVKALGYKHVIVLMQSEQAQAGLDYLYKANIDNCQDWMTIISTKEWRNRNINRYKKFYDGPSYKGLGKSRLMNMTDTKNAYKKTLKSLLDKDQLKDFEDNLEPILKLDGEKFKKAMNKFDEEHGVIPYIKISQDMGGKCKLHDPKTCKPTQGMVKFVQNKLKKLADGAEGYVKHHDKNNLRDDRYIFTTLDFLLDYYDASDPKHPNFDFFTKCKDVDVDYWAMYNALAAEFAKDDNTTDAWARVPGVNYLWYYRPVTDAMKMNKSDIENYIFREKYAYKPMSNIKDMVTK